MNPTEGWQRASLFRGIRINLRRVTDSYAKAKGLAQFAAKHSMDFGRIEVIRLVGKVIHRLDSMDATNRKRVLAVDSNAALDLIFGIANECPSAPAAGPTYIFLFVKPKNEIFAIPPPKNIQYGAA